MAIILLTTIFVKNYYNIMQTPEQKLLSKLYDYKDEIELYINNISVDKKRNKRDLNYKTILTVLSARRGLDNLISKLETVICDKQDLM